MPCHAYSMRLAGHMPPACPWIGRVGAGDVEIFVVITSSKGSSAILYPG
ncbi:MAG: hypothetical protein Q7J77_07750 [Undibacterium sp.]|nr:hypothetical protein [Undibacterium sp.]